MALKFLDNFFVYGAVGTSLASANTNFNTQWITHGGAAINLAQGLRNAESKALTLNRTTAAYGQVERRFETDADKVIFAFAFRASSRGFSPFILKNGEDVLFEVEWPNKLKVGADEGPKTIFLNKTYFLEVGVTKSTKQVEVRVNGRPYLTSTITADIPNAVQAFIGYAAPGAASTFTFGDFYFLDSSAGKYTDFIGTKRIRTQLVEAAVGSNWSPEPASRTNVQIMNNIPPRAGEFTESDIVGTKDFYTFGNPVAEDAQVDAVALVCLLGKQDIDEQRAALAISDGTTEKLGEDIDVPIQTSYQLQVFEEAPTGDWTPTLVNGIQGGPVVRPTP